MKAHSFDPADLTFVLSFLATFILAREDNCIHEGATMLAMPHFIVDLIASSLNCRMVQSDSTARIPTSINSNEVTLQALRFWSYLEVASHLLKRYTHEEAITEANEAILKLKRLANMM